MSVRRPGFATTLYATLLVLFCSYMLTAPSAPAAQLPGTALFPLSEIQRGMKGVGRSVFQGSKIEEFQVEILGVLKNVSPGQNIILGRLSGSGLERAGVLAGMSGSPVYIDGRLAGAVALAFQFSKDPIAGITPIEQMLQAFEEQSSPEQSIASTAPSGTRNLASPGSANSSSSGAGAAFTAEGTAAWRFESGRDTGEGPRLVSLGTPNLLPPAMNAGSPLFWEGSKSALIPVATPLVLSGFTAEAMQQFMEPLRSLGMIPVQGGGSGSSGGTAPGDPSKLQPGSMISVQLVRGDMSASADGTVTLVDNGRVYAFGHPFLSAGTTEFPFAESEVVTVLPSYASGMKITTSGGLLGVIGQDRSSGIFGTLGGKARTIPVEIEIVSSRGKTRSYNLEVVNDRVLLPFLVNFTAFSAIGTTERLVGESTLRVEQTIALDGLPDVKTESFLSGSANIAVAAAQSAARPMAYLMNSGVGPLDVQKVKLKIVSTDRRMVEELEQVWGSKREVKPGETLELTALLRSQDGTETLQKATVEIPPSLTPGPLTIVVADGNSMDRMETVLPGRPYVPKNPQQLVRAINKARGNNRLYVRLSRVERGFVLQGENFPSPPPSVVRALSTDPALSTNISSTVLSTVADYEMEPVGSVVTGFKRIMVTVKN